MDFEDTPEEAAFRAEARTFLDANAERKTPGTGFKTPDSVDELITMAKVWQARRRLLDLPVSYSRKSTAAAAARRWSA